MTFFPIVARELRVAARKSATYRTRSLFALATSLLAAFLLLTSTPGPSSQAGSSLFSSLVALAFLTCLAAGRHTADSVSEEKREGTLGLLFLTDLRGTDVIAGKLVSTSTRTAQGLFAFFPVLAITLLLGGVTAHEFWRCVAVLINTLFFALAVGLVISVSSRRAARALAGTYILLAFVAVVLPLIAGAFRQLGSPKAAASVGLFSPTTPLLYSSAADYGAHSRLFWGGLMTSHLIAWLFLLLASGRIRQAWQDRLKAAPQSQTAPDSPQLPTTQVATRQFGRRQRLLELNPICWLASGTERQRGLSSFLVVAGSAVLVLILLCGSVFGGGVAMAGTAAQWLLVLTLKLWLAWHAGSTLAESKQSGAVELILATPLTSAEIIRGHWLAFRQLFLGPVVVAIALGVAPLVSLALQAQHGETPLGTLLVMALFQSATVVADLVAIAWVAMWMGLNVGKPIRAFTTTVLLTMILPTFLFCVPNLLFDVAWISWARRKLTRQLRKTASSSSQWSAPGSIPPVVPA